MKVLLVNGSPHEKGCTFTALEEVAAQLEKNGIETEIFWIGNKAINGCTGCRSCFRGGAGRCVFNDDPVNTVIEKTEGADGVVFGAPVHFAGVAGNMHSLLDRVFYAGKAFAGKPGAAVLSCRRGGGTASFDIMNKYFTISSMPVVSSQYWNTVHGNTPDEVRRDEEGMQIMRTLGNNMAWLLKCIEAGRKIGVDFPTPERRISTNFIRQERTT
ncbi:MAG: flavodoxin family protein [Oscillospiraceae bacterium]|jgi:multimeric flavodoxin WrbA|nr:flavodoxin family protein [Oscillospiraceae bacterium]